jgi:hypothetical protein
VTSVRSSCSSIVTYVRASSVTLVSSSGFGVPPKPGWVGSSTREWVRSASRSAKPTIIATPPPPWSSRNGRVRSRSWTVICTRPTGSTSSIGVSVRVGRRVPAAIRVLIGPSPCASGHRVNGVRAAGAGHAGPWRMSVVAYAAMTWPIASRVGGRPLAVHTLAGPGMRTNGHHSGAQREEVGGDQAGFDAAAQLSRQVRCYRQLRHPIPSHHQITPRQIVPARQNSCRAGR